MRRWKTARDRNRLKQNRPEPRRKESTWDPRGRIFNRAEVVRLRDVEGLSWPQISRRSGAGVGTVVQAYRDLVAQRYADSTTEPRRKTEGLADLDPLQ